MSTTNGTDGSATDGDVAIAEAETDAFEVLTDVLQWRLPVARWERVTELVQSIDDAVLRRDLAALRSATADLELLSPVRITRIGSTQQKVETPAQLRERVNRLQHTLTGSSARHGTDDRRDDARDRPDDQR